MDSLLTFDHEQLILLDHGAYHWVMLKTFRIDSARPVTEMLSALIAHPRYRDSLRSPSSARAFTRCTDRTGWSASRRIPSGLSALRRHRHCCRTGRTTPEYLCPQLSRLSWTRTYFLCCRHPSCFNCPTFARAEIARDWGDRVSTVTAKGDVEASSEAFQVRPDGYVAWATDRADIAENGLHTALSGWFGKPA